MIRRLLKLRPVVLMGLAVVVVVGIAIVIAATGDEKEKDELSTVEDPDRHFPGFRLGVGTNTYAGPVPLTVNFKARPFDESGKVRYLWLFDDGFTSTKQNPTHTFTKPGYYLVGVSGEDSKGERFTNSLFLGAWPAGVWKRAQQRKINPLVEASKQRQRTRIRKREAQEQCEKSPDCRRRIRLAAKFERERRRKLRQQCLEDPKCAEAERKARQKNRELERKRREATSPERAR